VRKGSRAVVFLGLGGVGKTTYIYRVVGLSKTPRVTRRPDTYIFTSELYNLFLIDTPGQLVGEVVRRYYEAVVKYGVRIDLVVYMYSVVDPQTLEAIVEIDKAASRFIKGGKILVGNKRDLGKEIGIFVEGDDVVKKVGASGVYYTSALKDDPETLLLHIVENLR